jgi:hypothetical protein
MAGPQPRAARGRSDDLNRCPECGSGDLFTIEVARRNGAVWRGVYCAGEYDRDRRRFLRRSCGYAGAVADVTTVASESGDRPLPVAS